MNIDFPLLQALVRRTIQNQLFIHQALALTPNQTQSSFWTVQGFGMMRLNLEKVGRIHIWDHRLRVPGMNSDIHTHPWNLESTVISGEIFNGLYEERSNGGRTHNRSVLQTGEGGNLRGSPEQVCLELVSHNQYLAGEQYYQDGSAIHQTDFHLRHPTVTLMRRDKGPPDQTALVYWPLNEQWMTAEPRPATIQEVIDIGTAALANWG